MTTDIAGDFPTSGRVTHQCYIFEFERLDDRRKIVSIAIHIVSRRSLAGPTMSAPVMRDDAETVLREEKHLAVPGVGVQGPAV